MKGRRKDDCCAQDIPTARHIKRTRRVILGLFSHQSKLIGEEFPKRTFNIPQAFAQYKEPCPVARVMSQLGHAVTAKRTLKLR